MARIRFGLAGTLTGLAVLGHAVLLSLLYSTLGGVVQRSHETLFVEKVRTLSRLLAEHLEVSGALESPRLTTNLLDTAILNGDGVFAEVSGAGIEARSELGPAGVYFPEHEDFAFGEHGNDIYFIRMPLLHAGKPLELLLGFDERPTNGTIAAARRQMLWLLCALLGISALATLALGYAFARGVRRLQREARAVADGAHERGLTLRTSIRELHELADDLERMRGKLVAANDRLRAEISEKDALERQRIGLERQLQHRERLESIGTLAGGVAHEFNNVLMPIMLLTESALRTLPVDSRARSDLGTVLIAARRARELVKQILIFTREVSESKFETIDLAAVVRETVTLFEPLAGPNVRLQLRLPSHAARVRADATMVNQLVMNLCTNALQALAGKAGEIDIEISDVVAEAGDDRGIASGRYLQLSVRDTGHGMDAETAARVFEPFYTTRGVGQGTGLGLSVVHGIVRAFGGTITVESAPQSGSVFRVLLPVVDASTSAAAI